MGAGTDGEAGRSCLEDDIWRALPTVTPDAQPTTWNPGISNGAGGTPPAPLSWVLTKEKVKLGGPGSC